MRTRILALVATVFALACSSDGEYMTDPLPPVGLALSISPKTDTLIIDQANGLTTTSQLAVSATSMGNPVTTPPGRVFETADTAVVVVDPKTGEVVAVGVGTARVSVRVNDVKDFATIVVLPVVQSVKAAASATQALAGDTITVTASVIGWDGSVLTNQPITFTSSNPIATVSSSGKVVFSGAGAATITAKSGTATATVALTALARDFIGGANGWIASGKDATCGLLPLGKTFCFGLSPATGIANDSRCFGEDVRNDPKACTMVPLQIANSLQLTALTVGDSVGCGLDPQNRAYCWGDQAFGEVGNGISKAGTSTLPVPVRGLLGQAATFKTIDAGAAHVCALNSVGTAYCWGLDLSYQLGGSDEHPVNSSTPIPVDPNGSMTFTAIAAGRNHTCAIRSGDGIAMCWGANDKGQLGRGTRGLPTSIPDVVNSSVAFKSISALGDFTCALSTAGGIYCWGDDQNGQTGQAPDSLGLTQSPGAVAGSGYTSVSAGWAHACALQSSGLATCWGSNEFGQLGNKTWSTGVNSTPGFVTGNLTFSFISAGSRSTCGLAAAGGAYCWGSAVYGALGNEIQALKITSPQRTATPQ